MVTCAVCKAKMAVQGLKDHVLEQHLDELHDHFDLERRQKDESQSAAKQKISHNPVVQRKWEELGPFAFDDAGFEGTLGEREMRKPYKCSDGAIYTGEWLIASKTREGRGTLLYTAGDVFEGYWKDGKTNGKGRYIAQEGDIYEG